MIQNQFQKPESSQPAKTGIFYDLTNEQYHSSEGISKSGLDLIAKSPSVYKWGRSAPQDNEKTQSLDLGTALHAYLLEPEMFGRSYTPMPDFDMRTAAGKRDSADYLKDAESQGLNVLSATDFKHLSLMRESVMAHPVARATLEADGQAEASIFWIDQETGELCRVRPDRMISLNGMPIVLDVKTIGGMERLRRHVLEFRYHVQAAMYQDGYYNQFNDFPGFWFLFVDTSISAGRYRVEVKQLSPEMMMAGHELYRRDLLTYHQCQQKNDWLHVPVIE